MDLKEGGGSASRPCGPSPGTPAPNEEKDQGDERGESECKDH